MPLTVRTYAQPVARETVFAEMLDDRAGGRGRHRSEHSPTLHRALDREQVDVRAAWLAPPGWPAMPGSRRFLALRERGLDVAYVEPQTGFGTVPESDRSKFALVVVDEAPFDSALPCDRGGINEPPRRKIRRAGDRIDDGIDDAIAQELDDPPSELLDRHRC